MVYQRHLIPFCHGKRLPAKDRARYIAYALFYTGCIYPMDEYASVGRISLFMGIKPSKRTYDICRILASEGLLLSQEIPYRKNTTKTVYQLTDEGIRYYDLNK